MNITDEAERRYPVQFVNNSSNTHPDMVDVNETKRSIFIEGAEFASRELENNDCIIIKVQGIPLDRKDSFKKQLVTLFKTLNLYV